VIKRAEMASSPDDHSQDETKQRIHQIYIGKTLLSYQQGLLDFTSCLFIYKGQQYHKVV